jgi:hypothetical protein
MVARQKIHAGTIHAGKTATVIARHLLPGGHRRRNRHRGARTTTSEVHRYKAF